MSDHRSESGNEWREWKEDLRKMGQERITEALQTLTEFCQDFDLHLELIQDWQIRINGQIDIFPKGRRFHDLQTNKRGRYDPNTLRQMLINKIVKSQTNTDEQLL